MTEAANGYFDRLVEGFSTQYRADFFQILHEAGIDPRDQELAQLLRALQLYRAYYESIPSAIQTVVTDINHLKQEIAAISAAATQQAANVAQTAEKVLGATQQFHDKLAGIHSQLEGAIQKSIETLSAQMAGLLQTSITGSVLEPLEKQLTELIETNHALDQAIEKSRTAAAGMQKHLTLARRTHLGGYALASLVIVIVLTAGSWFFVHNSYAKQMARDRMVLVRNNEKNRQALLKLAENGRTIELRQDPKRPHVYYLVLKDATGWESSQHQGVIEFKE